MEKICTDPGYILPFRINSTAEDSKKQHSLQDKKSRENTNNVNI
jgi:hypothetical protein